MKIPYKNNSRKEGIDIPEMLAHLGASKNRVEYMRRVLREVYQNGFDNEPYFHNPYYKTARESAEDLGIGPTEENEIDEVTGKRFGND